MFYLYSSYAILALNNNNTRRDFDFKENHLLTVWPKKKIEAGFFFESGGGGGGSYLSSPGVETPANVHTMGWELNWDMVSWIFIRAVWNSKGANVTETSVWPWAGIIPVNIKGEIINRIIYILYNQKLIYTCIYHIFAFISVDITHRINFSYTTAMISQWIIMQYCWNNIRNFCI